jgi:hypothetical protein
MTRVVQQNFPKTGCVRAVNTGLLIEYSNGRRILNLAREDAEEIAGMKTGDWITFDGFDIKRIPNYAGKHGMITFKETQKPRRLMVVNWAQLVASMEHGGLVVPRKPKKV